MQTHRTTLLAAGVLTGLALVLLPAVAANAHNYAVSTVPVTGSTLTQLPAEFVITTNEDLLDLGGASKGFAIEIIDAAGKYYGDGCVSVRGARMATTAAVGAPGPYTLIWQGVSIDGHIASGKIPFTWRPSAETTTSVGSATPPLCGGVNPEAPTASVPTPPSPSPIPSTSVVDTSTSAVPFDSSAGNAAGDAAQQEAARTAASANTLLTLASIAAAALVIASAIIVTRRRAARKRLLGAPEDHA